MKRAPEVGSNSRPSALQPSALPLSYGGPHVELSVVELLYRSSGGEYLILYKFLYMSTTGVLPKVQGQTLIRGKD
jgi:hypothetical protein